MALVMGVGVGLFILAMFWSLSLLLCVTFSRAQGAMSYVGIIAILVTLLLTVILVVLPKESKVPTAEETTIVYDYAIIYRYLLISGCALFLLVGLVAYLMAHVMEGVYAKPLRKIR